MIAPVKQDRTAPEGNEVFLALLPQIRRMAEHGFRRLPVVEQEELVQEVVAQSLAAYQRLVERGRIDLVYATPLARFAIRAVRTGRRIGARLNSFDVLSPFAQKRRGIQVERIGSLDTEIREALVEGRNAGPADTAAARIDVAQWLRSMPRRTRRIARALATGEGTKAAARPFRLTPGRVSQLRGELRQSWEQFHGQDTAACPAAA